MQQPYITLHQICLEYVTTKVSGNIYVACRNMKKAICDSVDTLSLCSNKIIKYYEYL